MIVEERRRLIEQWIDRHGSVAVDELGKQLGVSAMTIWRDLKSMEDDGKIRRVHGGAVRIQADGSTEVEFANKQRVHSLEKEAIARFAAREYVDAGDILILEGGTTIASMVEHLDHPRLTVLTNGLDILNLVITRRARPTIMCCGGILRERSQTFVGPQAESFFHDFKAHKFFISATGLTLEEGLTDPNPLEIQMKRAMAACAKQLIALIDSSKFGLHSLSPILPLEKIDVLITDPHAPQDLLAALGEKGIEIRIAE